MYNIYAISDVHGMYEKFVEAINEILKVKKPEDKIIILGDNIDRGFGSLQIIQSIMNIQEEYGSDNVIALMGNHEEMFLAWLKNRYNLLSLYNGGTRTVTSFVGDAFFKVNGINLGYDGNGSFYDSTSKDRTKDVIGHILQNYAEEVEWMKNLKYFHEEGDTLFVHAGFDEIPGHHWSDSSTETMTWKYPAEMGYTPWNKRVVAGHIMTRELHSGWVPQEQENNIYRNKDHIYIDGGACSEIFDLEGQLNILQVKVNGDKQEYYDFRTGEIIPE